MQTVTIPLPKDDSFLQRVCDQINRTDNPDKAEAEIRPVKDGLYVVKIVNGLYREMVGGYRVFLRNK